MLDNPAKRLWHRVIFPNEFDADYEERILVEARSIAQRRLVSRDFLQDPGAVRELLAFRFLGNAEELFACLFLSARHTVIASEILFRGTIDGCTVHPRVIARYALQHNAAAVIVAHNHPSGNAEPSAADLLITIKIREALALIDVRVLDHFVIGANTIVSLAERGCI